MTKKQFKRPSPSKVGSPRNKLEKISWDFLKKNKVDFGYEVTKLPYIIKSTYIADFTLSNGIIVETKGYFRPEDKRKMKSVKACHKELDIRMVFNEANTPSSKKSLEQNIRWCKRQGFPYAIGCIPKEWIVT